MSGNRAGNGKKQKKTGTERKGERERERERESVLQFPLVTHLEMARSGI